MKISKSRYSAAQYRGLGYKPSDADTCLSRESRDRLDQIVKGQFKEVIDIIFSSTDGSLDSNPAALISPSAPLEVQTFAKAFLLQNINPAKAAPDDDTAFDMLVPRSVQTTAELAPYIDYIRNEVTSKLQSNDTPSTN